MNALIKRNTINTTNNVSTMSALNTMIIISTMNTMNTMNKMTAMYTMSTLSIAMSTAVCKNTISIINKMMITMLITVNTRTHQREVRSGLNECYD